MRYIAIGRSGTVGSVCAAAARWLAPGLLAATLALILYRGGVEIAGASEPYCNVDEPRHIMTAVFIYDLLVVRPLRDPVGFAYAYYGHYPAISVFHYPPLMHAMGGVLFLVTGPSVAAARALILTMTLLVVLGTWALAKPWLGQRAAVMAAVLLAGAPLVLRFRAVFMSEIPCMLWMVVAVLALQAYKETIKARYIWLSALAAAAAVLTKQHGVVLLPVLVVGAIIGFRREHWRALSMYLAPLVALAIAAAYYGVSMHVVRGSWVDLSTLTRGEPLVWIKDLAWGLGPLTIGLAAVGLVDRVVRRDFGWMGWIMVTWAGSVIALHATVVRTGDTRYMVYSAIPLAVLAAAFLQRLGGRWPAALQCVGAAAVVAVSWCQAWQVPGERLSGYETAAHMANQVSRNGPVVFGGTWDGPFVLYRRLDDAGLTTVTFRASKLFGGGNIEAHRGYTPFVSSPAEVPARFMETGARLVVLEENPEIDMPEHRWFWEWVHGGDFEMVAQLPVEYPNKPTGGTLTFFAYRGPVAGAKWMEVPMLTLGGKRIGWEAGRSLREWGSRNAGRPPPLPRSPRHVPGTLAPS